jgi:FkbM family methyltransferase
MNTPRVNWNPPLTRHLVSRGLFQDDPFQLVDVGASGGIDGYWEAFEPTLRAIGFDSLVNEVNRLNTAGDKNRRYYAYLVGDKSYRRPESVPDSQPFGRTSAVRANEITRCNYTETYFDQTGSGVNTTEMIELDEFFFRDGPPDVDFIKIDTDGGDYQVLCGARRLLSSAPVLGVAIECQFHGLVHDQSNTFRNIDRLLTGLGFSLFDLEPYRYSRAALPTRFVYRIPAQTESGQALWCDALYLRDLGSAGYEQDWSIRPPWHKICKLACLFEIFGMGDCAAELLLKYRAALAGRLSMDGCLDLLTPAVDGRKVSYQKYIRRFEQNPASFYPAE